jgi:probable rRNA maturation factor
VDPDSRRVRVAVTDGRGRPVRAAGLAKWLESVAPARATGEVGIALVGDAAIRDLNRRYRRKDRVTDVLAFPSDDGEQLGDIVIATGVAYRQALEAGHSYSVELRVLALHGFLHLLGYDHHHPADGGLMSRVEARLRRRGGLGAGLIERASGNRPRRQTRR